MMQVGWCLESTTTHPPTTVHHNNNNWCVCVCLSGCGDFETRLALSGSEDILHDNRMLTAWLILIYLINHYNSTSVSM
jgi:hypothetical protein